MTRSTPNTAIVHPTHGGLANAFRLLTRPWVPNRATKGPARNGAQSLCRLEYRLVACRLEDIEPFHVEFGYWYWDTEYELVMRELPKATRDRGPTGWNHGRGRSHALRLASEAADIIGIDICHDIESMNYPNATLAELAATTKLIEDLDRRIIKSDADVRDFAVVQHAWIPASLGSAGDARHRAVQRWHRPAARR